MAHMFRQVAVAAALMVAVAASQADPVVGISSLPKISVGEEHMLLAKTDGTVWSWGRDQWGQLGLGTNGGTSATPQRIPTLAGVVSVVARSSFSMALKADGTVWAWGDASNGRTGPYGSRSNVPVQVTGLSSIIGIEAGWGDTAYAIDLTGKVYAWGRNTYGELGTGSATPASVTVPQLISGLSSIVDLRAADTSVLALDSSGQVFQWAGFDTPTSISAVAGVSDAVAIGADGINNANAHFAVLDTGAVMSWGDTSSSVTRCGQPKQSGVTIFSPAAVSGFTRIVAVSSGPDGEDAMLDKVGQAWTCGGGSGGQQGDGTASGTSTGTKVGPLRVTQTTPFISVAMGKSAAAIGNDGSVWTWGPTGGIGVQGDGNLALSAPLLVPTKISITAGNPSSIAPVYAGTQTALNADGTSTVNAGVMFSPAHWNSTGSAYLAAQLPNGQLFIYSPAAGWALYNPSVPIPAVYSGTLRGMLPLAIGTMDFRGLAGTQVLVGYGLGSTADSEMLAAGRYTVVLTLR
jgi:alpha-tubulin suppressor-like RCC1 family protein